MSVSRFIHITISALTLFGAAASGNAQAITNQDLHDLGSLKELAYRDLRDQLLSRMNTALDVDAAASRSWQAGLAAMTLNARYENREMFETFDSFPKIRNHIGTYQSHPATKRPLLTSPYLTEQVWKTADIDQWRREAAHYLNYAPLPQDARFWQAVYEGSSDELLRGVALHGAAAGEGAGALTIVRAALANPATPASHQEAALTGMLLGKPSYAREVVTAAFPVLLTANGLIPDQALEVLSALDGDEARQVLYELIRDPAQAQPIRRAAIAACAKHPRSGDIAVVTPMLDRSQDDEMRGCVAMCLDQYPQDQALPLLRLLLKPNESDLVLRSAISSMRMVYHKGGNRRLRCSRLDLTTLRALLGATDLPTDIRRQATVLKDTIAGKGD